MKSPTKYFLSLVACAVLAGCATAPPPRPQLSEVKPLGPNNGRLVLLTGSYYDQLNSEVKLVLPMAYFVNGQRVGSTTRTESVIVDAAPGAYDINCAEDANRNDPKYYFNEKKTVTVVAGATNYYVCDMHIASKGLLTMFGLAGSAVSQNASSDVRWVTQVAEKKPSVDFYPVAYVQITPPAIKKTK